MSGAHATGVWVDKSGEVLGYGCADGTDCPTCFNQIEETADVAEFVSYDELDDKLDELIGDTDGSGRAAEQGQAAEQDDTRERVR